MATKHKDEFKFNHGVRAKIAASNMLFCTKWAPYFSAMFSLAGQIGMPFKAILVLVTVGIIRAQLVMVVSELVMAVDCVQLRASIENVEDVVCVLTLVPSLTCAQCICGEE